MSRVEELENEIKGLENRKIELLKELELEKQKTEIEYPLKEGDNYWCVTSAGATREDIWSNHCIDYLYYEQGNAFLTEKEAQREIERRALLTRFRQFRDKCNGDWKPFECDHQFYLSFDTMTNVIHINCVYINKSFALFGYFKNKPDCERAIDLFGDEIKRLFVEEE